MPPTYRDDRDAAMARADALLRENEHLRGEVAALRAGADPACDERSLLVHYRGAAATAVLLLGAMAGAAFVAHDTREAVAFAASEVTSACARPEPAFSDEAARRVLPLAAPPAAAPSREAGEARAGDVVVLPVAPLLRGCFMGLRGHVDVLAAVDARGRVRRVRVLSDAPARAVRAERRCARRSLRALTLPTTYGTFTAYEPGAELGLTLLPYDRVASR